MASPSLPLSPKTSLTLSPSPQDPAVPQYSPSQKERKPAAPPFLSPLKLQSASPSLSPLKHPSTLSLSPSHKKTSRPPPLSHNNRHRLPLPISQHHHHPPLPISQPPSRSLPLYLGSAAPPSLSLPNLKTWPSSRLFPLCLRLVAPLSLSLPHLLTHRTTTLSLLTAVRPFFLGRFPHISQ